MNTVETPNGKGTLVGRMQDGKLWVAHTRKNLPDYVQAQLMAEGKRSPVVYFAYDPGEVKVINGKK